MVVGAVGGVEQAKWSSDGLLTDPAECVQERGEEPREFLQHQGSQAGLTERGIESGFEKPGVGSEFLGGGGAGATGSGGRQRASLERRVGCLLPEARDGEVGVKFELKGAGRGTAFDRR
jgi:hypothetical protein